MSVFKLQHFSDTHAAINPTQATLRLMDQHEHHARVHTGDAVSNRFEQDFSYLAPYDFMFAMGNHDCILLYGTEHWVASGYDWTKQPSQAQLYEKFFKPTLRKNPVVIETNKTYWYRDYEEFGIRIIGINSCLRDDELFQEHLWFENVLADSKEKNLKVFVACHYPPYDVKATRCCFTDEMCMPSLYSDSMLTAMEFYPGIQSLYRDLCNIADEGLQVLGLLTGHEHGDGLFAGGNKAKFPILMVASVVIDYGWSNLTRSNDINHPACPLCNQYEYDDQLNTLRIRRLGATGRFTGEVCKLAIWDYNVSDFVNFFSRR